MDLAEIEQCLQKYAKELNEIGGTIYLKNGDQYYVSAKRCKTNTAYVKKINVDGADLVWQEREDYLTTNRMRCRYVRIPYHSISSILIEDYED